VKTNFWQKLELPIIGLSPMDGVTDFCFRQIIKKYSNPDIIYTEFTNVEGVCHGALKLLKDFLYDESQRPIIAQIYGTTPEYFRQTAVILCELGFDGIDINMGCPAKSVDSSGAGAALIKKPKLAQEIISAVRGGINDYQNGLRSKDCPDISPEITKEVVKRHDQLPDKYKLGNRETEIIPVSVKTRVGYDKPVVEDWIPTLLEMKVAAIALHGRTLKQQYSGQADWSEIGKAATLCKNTDTILLGNGDVDTYEQALELVEKFKVDGVLMGRSALSNPFVFKPNSTQLLQNNNIFQIALEHCKLYEQTYSQDPQYHFLPMRKYLGWYVKGMPFAREIRIELFQTNSAQEVENIFKKHNLI
jgi:tRNA-dihydrouridine synthase B